MAKQKPESGGREDQLPTRLFREDSRRLQELASLMGLTTPECYRAVCGPVVDAALIAAARRRAAELEQESKGKGKSGDA